ncbi:ABC transporter substrate-binding protein [Xylanibacillus composti]|uniref:ABC transporter substrate-binding protein n=1 Tax=Xylanibacillus composti TaxID=1572762 RepID=A0A8J4H333_9BACL|nr:ABC transporter substrate-binding protein [Xylanibacillus composti]MDT9723928.1 ABC transporter substrate-binding protein [Xylanibacillus composti]GIQ67808.1 ABC transporter substrate-binding protein [Xylanibacillus composti]
MELYRKIGLLLAVVTLLAAASGCSEADKGGELPLKEELILAIGGEPEEGFDPTTGWGRYGSPLFQSTLFKRDHEMKLVPDLATDYSISEDGLRWTVTLREDVLFTDGEPLTSADVQYTFEQAALSGSTIDLSNLMAVEAPEPYTVVFRLAEPQSAFLHMLVATGIVPAHAHDERYARQPIGSGPYKLVQWDRGQQLIAEANPDYYGTQPNFKKLVFLFLPEDAAFAAARAGQVDIAAIPPAFSKQEVPGMRLEAIRSVDNRGIMFPYVPAGEETAAGYPIGNDVTADRAIRRAINVALDRAALVDGVLEGYGTPAYTLNDGLPWFQEEAVIEDGRPEEAQKLLAEAGWVDTDGDGVLEKGELQARFRLLYPAGDVTRQSLALAAADMIRPIGIEMEVEGKSWDDIRKQMHANAVLLGWGSHDPQEMAAVYGSSFRGVDFFNPGYYSNMAVDAYMRDAQHATSEEEAIAFWKKAQWDGTTGLSAKGDAPWAWLVNLDHLYLVKEELDIGRQQIHPHGHGWPVTDNIEEWQWR